MSTFDCLQEDLLGEGCEFLREALASIPAEKRKQLQKASQAAFASPSGSPLGSSRSLQIPSPTRGEPPSSVDLMRFNLRWQVKVVRRRPPLRGETLFFGL